MLYNLRDVFFSFDTYEFDTGKLEYSTNPEDFATASTIDRGLPVVSIRDPRTITHIFSLEVDLGSEDYKILTALSYAQFYKAENKINKMKRLVFNDGINLKLVSTKAFFPESSTRQYSLSSEKVTFLLHAVDVDIEVL